MFIGKLDDITRRAFLQRSGQFAIAGAASSYALGLHNIAQAAAFDGGGGYKALVCIFLFGGNDHSNMIVPFDASNYARYSAIRGGDGEAGGGIAIPRADLAATALTTPDDQRLTNDIRYAMNPFMPRMARRFAEKRMAPLLNVGPLVAPLTLEQYKSSNHRAYPRPAKLFSHNDQQSTWQSFNSEGSTVGWGGRLGDLALSSNHNAIFTCVSAGGNAVFLPGSNAFGYQVSNKGAVGVNALSRNVYGHSGAREALRSLMTQSSGHVLEADYARTCQRSIQTEGFLNDALSKVSVTTDFTDPAGNNRLAGQLEIVARMIAARSALGVKRQVFFVSMGGFDNHDDLMAKHGPLMGQLDFAMDAFYRATVELGVADAVTSFTASDFGRTLASNGDGSDHGWGSHHMVLGGAVNGGRFFGTAPHIGLDTPDQVGQGRLLPTTSVDQYSSTLARWFGVAPSELPTIAPNIGRFATADLGFMG